MPGTVSFPSHSALLELTEVLLHRIYSFIPEFVAPHTAVCKTFRRWASAGMEEAGARISAAGARVRIAGAGIRVPGAYSRVAGARISVAG